MTESTASSTITIRYFHNVDGTLSIDEALLTVEEQETLERDGLLYLAADDPRQVPTASIWKQERQVPLARWTAHQDTTASRLCSSLSNDFDDDAAKDRKGGDDDENPVVRCHGLLHLRINEEAKNSVG